MKNKLLAVLATFGMVASASAVKINNNLSINGFIDGSISNVDADGAATHDETNIGIDEVELNFLVNAGNVSGELHIDNNQRQSVTTQTGVVINDATVDNNGTTAAQDLGQNLEIEQVFFTYSFSNGLSATVGRFGSALGFEREDPAGLYTFSRAYSGDAGAQFNLGDVDGLGAQEGVRLAYSAGQFSFSASAYNPIDAVEETNDNGDGDTSEDNLNYEIAVSFNGFDNLVIGAGVQVDNGANVASAGSADTTTTNIHGAYTLDKLLLGAEYVNIDQDAVGDVSAYLILADYDINDKVGLAVRYSEWETNVNGAETNKLSIAPNYAITDSLGAILEWASTDTGAAQDEDQLALELTYTF